MYEIVVGATPFGGDSIPMIIQDILFTEFRPNSSFSKHFSSLLKGLLNKDPHQRLGNEVFGGAQTIKNHPFF
jgi:serum/glucocorticoid-regulated kinase 2